MARGLVGWPQHSGKTSVIDRKVKRSGQRPQYIPTSSFNCVCVLDLYSTTRYSAGRIMTAINPQRRLWNAETWTLGSGQFYLFALEKLSIEKKFFFSLPHFLGAEIVLC
ncbi:hypothetical protein AVEN_25644-1 [Araneus ventricosus]|uniref:Uncharacterized protein n=1 Tax=Araneus ventricosus TaxID=182803 RepID=A0A4Y2BR36_ARAVE|nr:hypothetical protein AVEN_25644-1 [Araneus ventricosus]